MADTSDPVFVFRRIAILIGKWLLAAVAIVIGLALLITVVVLSYNWLTYTQYADKVEFLVRTTRDVCADDKYPVGVLVGNKSSKTIERVSFRLSARLKGRSTDIVQYQWYSDDHIIQPNTGYELCWAPTFSQTVSDPRTLDWSIKEKTIYFR